MIKAVIIEDEQNCSEYLSALISQSFNDIQIAGIADTLNSGFSLINQEEPDLVFLDIMLSNNNAFELLRKFDKINFEIIFTTAHDEFSLKALKVSALDYLLKPIDKEELNNAILKFKEKNNKLPITARINNFIENTAINNNKEAKIVLPNVNGFIIVAVSDIIFCKSDNNYSILVLTSDAEQIITLSLKQIEKLLSEYSFIRIHQSHLINLFHIKKYVKKKNPTVIMSNKTSLNVSIANKDILLQKLLNNF